MRPFTKWDHVGTSIFTRMTQEAVQHGAVNLAQGFPDFDGPEAIKEAAIAAIRSGLNQYAPAAGLPGLRQALSHHQARRTGLAWGWDDEVTVFSGATEAIFCAMQAFLSTGDEVLALDPAYDSYAPAAYAAGARLIGVPLIPPRWTLDATALAAAITPRTRVLLINNPHNPTGRVFDADELEVVRRLAIAHDLLVITDEVYEELVYTPGRHLSLAALPGMRERTITVSSTTKTFSFTGWKVGYAFAPAPLAKSMRAVHQFTVFCSATPLQAGMIAALALADDYFVQLRQDYLKRRDALVAMLNAVGFTVEAPLGTYFVLADYRHLSRLPDVDFALWLTRTAKVAAVPISVFYSAPATAVTHGYVRLAFCKNLDTIAAAAARLKSCPFASAAGAPTPR